MKIKITYIEEALGTKAANVDLFTDYIASKCPDDDLRKQELETAEHKEEAGTTLFHRDADGELILWDYQVKGFLKEGGDCIRQCKSSEVSPTGKGKKWGAIKSKIDNFVNVSPRQIKLGKKEPDAICERPLIGMTAQGRRTSLARSEVVNPGTFFTCEIDIMEGAPVTEKMVEEILDYGERKGISQWRNSGKGRFKWEKID